MSAPGKQKVNEEQESKEMGAAEGACKVTSSQVPSQSNFYGQGERLFLLEGPPGQAQLRPLEVKEAGALE